jgi:LCP family protein required for cell wall assembly
MKTTLKRGVGRAASLNGSGNGGAVFPPGTVSAITRYRQPPPTGRSGLAVFGRILLVTLLVLLSAAAAVAGGSYLYFHQSVAQVRAHTPDVKVAQKQLEVTPPGAAAIALVVGYDHRAGRESGLESRSDTIMLLRADPETKTISMLSFPRDLRTTVVCPGRLDVVDRINYAYERCGAKGTLATVRRLTQLPVNYLITVNFRGFKQIINTLGGVWMDVDRRYYNRNVGTADTNFADIDLQPGYQRLNATHALEFVRYRHTDSDLTRLERQQQFVRAFKQQVAQNFSVTKLPGLISAITHNVEVGVGGGRTLSGATVLSYGLFAATLPPGHFFQSRIENLSGYAELEAPASSIQQAIDDFEHPDVEAPKAANAAALGRRLRTKAPPPSQTTVTVLNGNGVPGAAGNAAYQLAQRKYRIVEPPNGRQANAPARSFHTKVYFDARKPKAKAAAHEMQKLLQPADVQLLPKSAALRVLNPGSMLIVVVGQTFHGQIAPARVRTIPKRQPASVRSDRSATEQLLASMRTKVPFRLMVPTVLDRSSNVDYEKPVRMYWIKKGEKAVRMTFRTGMSEYWGIEQTDWNDAPVLADRSFTHILGDGRRYDFYYSGPKLHMVVLRAKGATYWVVNTLLDALSNETMIAIAKGLKPLTSAK